MKKILRRLEKKDIPFMLEWMHDKRVNCYFRYPFSSMNEEKAMSFIENSFSDTNIHFAFTDDNDEYLGTVSLKNISESDKNAEYAIVARYNAQGTGATRKATEEILAYAFDVLHLHKVYLNVLTTNKRAISFYKNCGFEYEGIGKEHCCIDGKYYDLEWYGIIKKR